MRERASIFRGQVNITGARGKGTRVSVSIPIVLPAEPQSGAGKAMDASDS
jgi:hypothetical protein